MKKAAIVLVIENDKILAVSRKGTVDDFGLPGGKVEDGECTKGAASREFIEETGSEVCNLRFLDMVVVGEFEVSVFSGEAIRTIVPHTNIEGCRVDWVSLETLEAGTLDSGFSVRRYLK